MSTTLSQASRKTGTAMPACGRQAAVRASRPCPYEESASPEQGSEDPKSSNNIEAGDILRALRRKGNEWHPANRMRPAR